MAPIAYRGQKTTCGLTWHPRSGSILLPGIDHFKARIIEISHISGNQPQLEMQGGGGKQTVD